MRTCHGSTPLQARRENRAFAKATQEFETSMRKEIAAHERIMEQFQVPDESPLQARKEKRAFAKATQKGFATYHLIT